jgi:hypothetical protein
VSPLKIKIPSKNLGRQRCAEGFNSGVEGLMRYDGEFALCGKNAEYLTV